MSDLKTYDVTTGNGYTTTFQYSDEDAKVLGLLGKDTGAVAAKQAKAAAEQAAADLAAEQAAADLAAEQAAADLAAEQAAAEQAAAGAKAAPARANKAAAAPSNK